MNVETAFISKQEARLFLLARTLFPIPFLGAMLLYFLGIDRGFLIGMAIATPALFFCMRWRCPRCKKSFSVKVGVLTLCWPYFNYCLHCGAKIKESPEANRSLAVNAVRLNISSIADFDKSLIEEYARFVGYFPEKPESFVQRRFAQYGIFPELGWTLIGIGETQALSSKNPEFLYATIARFVKCAHGCWGPSDERGLHWGGYDFCSLVVPSLYSALLGKTYIASAFFCGRPMSTKGYGAYKHAANLMVCLECKTWKHRDEAIAGARSFVLSKSNSKTNKAFVSFFLGVLTGDRTGIAEALTIFSAGYLGTDWGQHKPQTKPTFIQAMIAYAQLYLENPVDERTYRSLISGDRIELWQEFERHIAKSEYEPHQFIGPLSFLNDITV